MRFVLPLAHLGHWYLWVPYMLPVFVVLAASIHAFRQQRREDREAEEEERRSAEPEKADR
jgi:heme exporter protein D